MQATLTRDADMEENEQTSKPTNRFFIIFGTIAAVVLAGLLTLPINSNPLIGKWVFEKQLPFAEKQTLEFSNEQVSSMGVTEKVTYSVDGDNVTVIDKEGRGFVYTVVDENTIESNFAGMKVRYIREK